jgi:hypothetical protein
MPKLLRRRRIWIHLKVRRSSVTHNFSDLSDEELDFQITALAGETRTQKPK